MPAVTEEACSFINHEESCASAKIFPKTWRLPSVDFADTTRSHTPRYLRVWRISAARVSLLGGAGGGEEEEEEGEGCIFHACTYFTHAPRVRHV